MKDSPPHDPRPIDLLAAAVTDSRPAWIRCISCDYSLYGLPAGRCPECGHQFDPAIPITFTTELGGQDRVIFARTAAVSLTVIALVPLALAVFTDWLILDLFAVAGTIQARRLVEGRSTRGDGLALLFLTYALLGLSIALTLHPLDPASWVVRRHHFPVWYPLMVVALSILSLVFWRKWKKARETTRASSNR